MKILFGIPVEQNRIDFAAINAAAMRDLPTLLRRLLPDGQIRGREFLARNPRRADSKAGSFKINRPVA